MHLRHKLGELIVPAIVLLGCFLYWWHIQDARAIAQRVPNYVIIFTVAMTVLGMTRALLLPPAPDEEQVELPERGVLLRRLAFVAACFGYFFAFSWLGFNLANLGFLVLACLLAGLKLPGAVVTALASTIVFHFLARAMDFRVPTGPFGF